jgi:hypothetical protein
MDRCSGTGVGFYLMHLLIPVRLFLLFTVGYRYRVGCLFMGWYKGYRYVYLFICNFDGGAFIYVTRLVIPVCLCIDWCSGTGMGIYFVHLVILVRLFLLLTVGYRYRGLLFIYGAVQVVLVRVLVLFIFLIPVRLFGLFTGGG